MALLLRSNQVVYWAGHEFLNDAMQKYALSYKMLDGLYD